MGSASSAQVAEAFESLGGEFKVVAGIIRPVDENAATSLEVLSQDPDLSTNQVILMIRDCLIAGIKKTPSNRKQKTGKQKTRKPKTRKPKASKEPTFREPTSRETVLYNYFSGFGLEKGKIDRLVSLAGDWESQQTDILQAVEKEAPRWKKDYRLFWGKRIHSAVPLTAVAKVKHLSHEIEDLKALSPVRRRLFLVIIDETIEGEKDLLSETIDQLRDINNRYTAIEKELSKLRRGEPNNELRHEDRVRRYTEGRELLIERRTNLHNQCKPYPQGPNPRSRVVQKLANDLWGTVELSEGEREKKKQDLVNYARWGRKYSRLGSLGILLFLGDTSAVVYEREEWDDSDYKAVRSYWDDLSGIHHLCDSYSYLMENLKQGYWSLLSTDSTVQESLRSGSAPSQDVRGTLQQTEHAQTLEATTTYATGDLNIQCCHQIPITAPNPRVLPLLSEFSCSNEDIISQEAITPRSLDECAFDEGDTATSLGLRVLPVLNEFGYSDEDIISQDTTAPQFPDGCAFGGGNNVTTLDPRVLPLLSELNYSSEDIISQDTMAPRSSDECAFGGRNIVTPPDPRALLLLNELGCELEDTITPQDSRTVPFPGEMW
ncbi:hypothetical protein FGG08_003140 [Glutinoglossum americanum]|uniref:Uncharacterized protein n=1 Tax=Glutinoglossum americanum TaxID=1670608 RepID=A0A9P8I380_9PEZI|nr:hypothetical protein FGG08_003140 [Glutinoglossum americanum]